MPIRSGDLIASAGPCFPGQNMRLADRRGSKIPNNGIGAKLKAEITHQNPAGNERLFTEFPELFRGPPSPVTQNLMGFGFECGGRLVPH